MLWLILGSLAACSGGGGGTSGVVTAPPVAAADNYSTGTGQTTLIVSTPGVLANDTGTGLTAEIVGGPAHAASFTLNPDGSFNYVHDSSSVTTDNFTYRATNGGGTSTATVAVTITPPLAAADTYSIGAPSGSISPPSPGVLANDTGTGLTAEIVGTGPAHAANGSFTLNSNGSFTYTHNGDTFPTDSFTYRAKVGSIVSNTVTVTINVNQPPVASNFCATTPASQTLAVSLSGHVTDPNTGDTVTCKLGSSVVPVKGTVSDAGGVCTYMPKTTLPGPSDGKARGVDKFSIRAVDSQGLQSNEVVVTVMIDGAVRIMPLGDSITAGYPGDGSTEANWVGYRRKLFNNLSVLYTTPFGVNFVGTVTTLGASAWSPSPPADRDNEGHDGWRDDEIANGTTDATKQLTCFVSPCNITGWLNSTQPDMVLLHIGTNGINDPGGTSSADVATILDKIKAWESANSSPVTVFLAKIIGSPDATTNANVTTFNSNVTSMAQTRISNGDKIVIVNQQTGAGLNYQLGAADGLASGPDMGDSLHPNQDGYDKMADKWKLDMLGAGVLPSCP